MSKDKLKVEAWLKELGPSHELRQWFGHDPERWPEFKKRYALELAKKKELWQPLIKLAESGTITLVYSARDEAHNQAVALASFLKPKARSSSRKK